MIITPDFSEASENTSEPIPSGIYNARILDAEQKTSKNGEAMIKWKLQLFGAEGALAKFNNWPVYHHTMCVGRGAGMLRDFVKAATGEVPAQIDTDAVLGKEVQLTLKQRLNDDGTTSNWPDVKAVKALR